MDTVTELDLLALVIDALDPSRRRGLLEAASRDPALNNRLIEARASVAGWRDWDSLDENWRLPPPRARWSSLWATVAPTPVMGRGDELSPGDLFEVRIGGVADLDARWLVVLLRLGENWHVVSPTVPDELIRLDQLPRMGDTAVLELSAADHRGVQRWAIAMPTLDMQVDWTRPEPERWSELQEAVLRREIPSLSVDVVVR